MSGTAVDNILQRLRKQREEQQGHDEEETAARFLVTKLSWRGNYRRILAVTSTSIITQHPDSLAITNAWTFANDPDIAGVEVGGESADGGAFTLQFRKDKKGIKSRDARFVCRERAAFLTAVFDAFAAAAAARGSCGEVTVSLLGHSESYPAFKLRKGEWVPVILRVSPTALERINVETKAVKWRWGYAIAASPAIRLLASGGDTPAGHLSFAVMGRTGRSPRVYAVRDREGLLRAVQTAALTKIGVSLAIDGTSVVGKTGLSGRDFLAMISSAERERAATPEEAPLGEWEVLRVHDPHEIATTTSVGTTTTPTGSIYGNFPLDGAKAVVPRRLVLTAHGLLERRPATYEVAEWRQLPAVAALVRYSEDSQWLGVEWSDGASISIYVTPARDALLAGLLYAVQAAAGRPVPILSSPTGTGIVIAAGKGQFSIAPAVVHVDEVEKMMVVQLTSAANEFLGAGGADMSLNALALAGLTAAATATTLGGGVATGAEGSSSSSNNSTSGGGGGGTRAIAALEHRIQEFNGSVPYSGVVQGIY